MDTGTLMPLGPNVVGRNGPRVINPNLGLEAFDNGGVVGGVVGGHVPSAAQSSETPRDSAVHETEQADATLRQADATTMGDVTLRPPQLDLSEAQEAGALPLNAGAAEFSPTGPGMPQGGGSQGAGTPQGGGCRRTWGEGSRSRRVRGG